MAPSLKAVTKKVCELLDSENGSEMVPDHYYLPSVSDVLHHLIHLQESVDSPKEGDMLRLTYLVF